MFNLNFSSIFEAIDKTLQVEAAVDRGMQEALPHVIDYMDRHGLAAGTVADALEVGNKGADLSTNRDPGIQDASGVGLRDGAQVFNPHPAQFHNQMERFLPGPRTRNGRALMMLEIINPEHLDAMAAITDVYVQAEKDKL